MTSHTIQTAINNAKPWQHQQPFVPMWAVRSRALYFFQVGHKLKTSSNMSFRSIKKHTPANQNCLRGGKVIECSVGVATTSRLQSWQTTSYILFASPFFVTVAPVRHLDPRSFITIRAQGCVHCKTKPIIDFWVGFEQQISSHS